MAITLSQNPGEINQAYGVNAVTLSGITNEDKYVLRIKNQAGDVVADVRQTPNRYGYSIFNIQNILQTYVKPGDTDIDSIGIAGSNRYRNSFNLGFLYDIEWGSETAGVFTADGTLENLEVYPGRKEYYEINWPISEYTTNVSIGPLIKAVGKGLTDNPTVNQYTATINGNIETLVVNAFSTLDQSFDPDLGNAPISFQDIVLNDGGWRTTPPYNFYIAQETAGYRFKVEGQITLQSFNPGDEFPPPFKILRNSDQTLFDPDVVIGWPDPTPLPGVGVLFNYTLEWNQIDLVANSAFNVIYLPNQAQQEARIISKAGAELNIYKIEVNSGGTPETITFNAYEHTVRPTDQVTVSYLQNINFTGTEYPESTGISAFTILTYDASNNLLFENTYPNIISDGGGPYNTQGEGITPSYPYSYITFGAGPRNLQSIDFTTAAYYYVIPRMWNPTTVELDPAALFYCHKFTIDRGICLDFEPIQFSWMNSLGTRDYYTFTKKNERSVRIKRDTYLKSAADYNGSQYATEKQDRGTTTYSQTLSQEYITNTDYISDLDAEWLESLFVSPDVRVRFDGELEWVPVTLTSTSYTQKTFRKDRLFQYEVRFRLAHGIKSQRG